MEKNKRIIIIVGIVSLWISSLMFSTFLANHSYFAFFSFIITAYFGLFELNRYDNA